MYDTVDCPYCGHENDMSDALCDGLGSDNTLDWECSECEKEFEVLVEFEPSFSASKIEYVTCSLCNKPTRDIYEKGRIVPFPKKYEGMKLCSKCFHKGIGEEIEKEMENEKMFNM